MKRARRWSLIVLVISAIALIAVAGCNNPVGSPTDDGGSSTPQDPDTPDPPAVPSIPSGLASSSVSHDSATLSWDAVADASGYELYRSPDSTVTTTDTLVYDGSGTSTSDTGLSGSTAYYYAVLAKNAEGSSGLSSAVLVTTPATPETPPATPTGFAVTGTTESSLVLEWDAASDVDNYYLYGADAEPVAQEAGNLVEELDGTDSTAAATGLTSETTYYFALVAKNGAGESSAAETSGTTTAVPVTPPASAPSNLALVADSETTTGFELGWDAVADASSYKVYRSTTAGVTTGDTLAYNGPLTNFEETGLASGTTYYYAVGASNAAGDSATLSTEIDATTLPAKVANVSVTANATNPTTDLDVAWDAVSTAAIHSLGYKIAWDVDDTFPAGQTDLAVTNAYTATGLDSGTTYYVRVRAVFDNGLAGAWSSIRTGSTDAALTAPANLTVGGATTSSLDVSWDAVTGADGYYLYQGPTGGGPWTEVYTGSGTSYTDSGLTADTDYYYAVKAYDTNGSSDLSTAVAGTTLAAAPGAPTGLDADVLDASRISLSWNAVDGATSYVVKRDGTGVSGNVLGTSYTDSGLSASTTYTYTVYAQNAQGTSPDSASVQATTMTPPPDAPTGVTAGNPGTLTIDVSWNTVTGADAYKVYRSTDDVDYSYVTLEDGTSYTDSGLQHSTTYYYKVAATNIAGESARSAAATATTLVGVDRPSLYSPDYLVDSILVYWSPVANATEYEVQRSDADATTYTTVYTGADLSAIDTGITPGDDYRYRVRARNANGPGLWSGTRSAYAPSSAPYAPALSVDSWTDARVDLSWSDESAEYEVYRSTTSPVGTGDTPVYSGTSRAFTDASVSAATTYYYAVVARNYAGDSALSDEQMVTTSDAPGAPPSSLSVNATPVSSVAIDVTFSAVDADAYTVYRSTDATVDASDNAIYSGPATSFQDAGLEPATQYWYAFVATNSAGSTDNFATPATATTDEAVNPPAAPTLEMTWVGHESVDLWWSSLADATEYRLYRSESDTGPWDASTLLVTLPAGSTGYSDNNLAEVDAYYYAVRGVNDTVLGDVSNVVRAAIVEVIVE